MHKTCCMIKSSSRIFSCRENRSHNNQKKNKLGYFGDRNQNFRNALSRVFMSNQNSVYICTLENRTKTSPREELAVPGYIILRAALRYTDHDSSLKEQPMHLGIVGSLFYPGSIPNPMVKQISCSRHERLPPLLLCSHIQEQQRESHCRQVQSIINQW